VRADCASVSGRESVQAKLEKVAQWGKSRGAQADVDRRRRSAGKRALLRGSTPGSLRCLLQRVQGDFLHAAGL